MKEYKIYLPELPDHDLYIKDKLHELDLMISELSYREGISMRSRLVIAQAELYLSMLKAFAISCESVLTAEVDQMLATVSEIVENEVGIGAQAVISVKYNNEVEECPIAIDIQALDLLAQSFFSPKDNLGLEMGVSAPDTYTKVALGDGEGGIEIGLDFSGEIKRAMEQFEPSLGLDAQVGETFKHSFESVDAQMGIGAELDGPFYRYSTGAESGLAISVTVGDIELHYSLGDGASGIGIGVDSPDTAAKKSEIIVSDMGIGVDADMTKTGGVSIQSGMGIEVEAEFELRRMRRLYEMDDQTLANYDSMTMSDVDYILLD